MNPVAAAGVRLVLAVSPSPSIGPEDLGGQHQGRVALGLIVVLALCAAVGVLRRRRGHGGSTR